MSSTKNVFYIQDAQIICLAKELGTVEAIAKILSIGEKSLNVYTKRIEERFQKSIFLRNRRKKSILLTADGMEMYPVCKSILEMMGGEKIKGPVNPRDIQGEVKLTGTQTILEYFHLPYLVDFVDDHPKIIVNLNQLDDLYPITQGVNEIYFTIDLQEDTDTFTYFPYHEFIQRLWASESYLQRHGTLDKIEDFYRHHFLFQRGYLTEKIMGSNKVKSSLGIVAPEARCFNIAGSRIIDKACELGLGVMTGSDETVRLSNLNLINILPKYESDAVVIYIKIHNEFLEKNIGKLIVDWIFECRDKSLEKAKCKKIYPHTPLLNRNKTLNQNS